MREVLDALSDEFGKKKSFRECLEKLEEEMVEVSEEYKISEKDIEYNDNFKIELLDVFQATYSTLVSMERKGKITSKDIEEWKKKQEQRKNKYLKR